jgi:hypothetical protein
MREQYGPTLKAELRTAMENYIRAPFVGIFQFRSEDHPKPDIPHIGSAVTFQIAGRVFLATAAHNFKDIPNGGKFHLFSATNGKSIQNIAANLSEHGKSGTLDLAWLELDPLSAKEANLTPLPFDCIDPRHLFKDVGFYLVTGMPAATTQVTKKDGITNYNFHIVVYGTEPIDQPDADGVFRLQYLPDAMTHNGPAKMPEPHGMSGGAVWYVPPDASPLIWTPTKYHIIGVILQYDRRVHEVSGLQMYRWLEFFSSDYPELQDHIAPLLNKAP